MRRAAVVALVAGLALSPAEAQWWAEEAFSRAGRVPASQLDAALPDRPFADWLAALVGPARIRWELNDCGEQTGGPADRGRDLPACAEASAALPDGREVGVMIQVGTWATRVSGPPAVRLIWIRQAGGYVDVPRLSDLPRALGRATR